LRIKAGRGLGHRGPAICRLAACSFSAVTDFKSAIDRSVVRARPVARFVGGSITVAYKLMHFQNFYQLFRTIQAV
jgi:hypothetical protein